MKLKGFLAGLDIAGKLALGVGVAAAATTGAGAAGVLPGSVQHVVSQAVGAVSPFSLPDGEHHGAHDANPATGDATTTTVAADVTTTSVGPHEPEKSTHDGDKGAGGVVTPTTVAEHHDSTGTTPTTVAEHHDNNGSTTGNADGNTDGNKGDGHGNGGSDTTTPTTVHHDGDNNNPQAITLNCTRSFDPASISCTWSASPNADHAKFILLRTGDGHGRVLTESDSAQSFTDTTVAPGGTYQYLVDSLRADGSVDAHSNRVTLTCCGDAPTTTTTVGGDHH